MYTIITCYSITDNTKGIPNIYIRIILVMLMFFIPPFAIVIHVINYNICNKL